MTVQQSPSNHTASPPSGSEPCVLVIDDSRVMRVALSRLLSKRYRVVEAEDGEQGWQAIENQPDIELVFCDLSMPKMDGFELLTRVRSCEDKHISSLPFVVITGHEDDAGMQTKAAQMGASDFVSKPFRSAEITTRAKTLIGQRRDMRRLRAELDVQATRDALTGLADATHFALHFTKILALAERHGLDSACLVLQLDGFDRLAAELPRDQLHGLLSDVAEQLQRSTRTEDAIGYLGDGCYGVAMSGAGRDGARLLATRLATQLAAAGQPGQSAPGLLAGVSTPVSADTTSAAELLRAARADLEPLSVQAGAPAAPAGDAGSTDIDSVLSMVESALASAAPPADSRGYRQELEQARAALRDMEQAHASLTAQLQALKDGAREQVAKAHRELATTRSQLNAVQGQFHDYIQAYSRETQEQAETEIAELRAVLAERDEQLASESVLRRQAQEMVRQLQATLAETTREAEEAKQSRGGLLGRLFRRR